MRNTEKRGKMSEEEYFTSLEELYYQELQIKLEQELYYD